MLVIEVDLYGNNTKGFCLLTATLPDDRHMVYIPFAPVINIGQVHIVAKENIKIIDVPIKEVTEIILRVGFEADKIYEDK